MFCRGYGFYGMGFPFGMLFSMAFCILIIAAAVKLYSKYLSKSSNAMAILNEKYANGSINEEEYLRKRNFLENHKN